MKEILKKFEMTQPQSFYLIIDKDGEPVDVLFKQMKLDYIFSLVEGHQKQNPKYAPYTVWKWHNGSMTKVVERRQSVEIYKRNSVNKHDNARGFE